jgi:cobalt-zinc-cadmium efflux system protein
MIIITTSSLTRVSRHQPKPEDEAALSTHIVTSDRSVSTFKPLKEMLKNTYGLTETILEFEHPSEACSHAETIGHG